MGVLRARLFSIDGSISKTTFFFLVTGGRVISDLDTLIFNLLIEAVSVYSPALLSSEIACLDLCLSSLTIKELCSLSLRL